MWFHFLDPSPSTLPCMARCGSILWIHLTRSLLQPGPADLVQCGLISTRSLPLVPPTSLTGLVTMVYSCKSKNNGFNFYENHGININKTANKYLIFEIIQEGSQTFSNTELKEHGKIFNWDRLPHVQFYIVIELSTNSAMVYHSTSSGKVS